MKSLENIINLVLIHVSGEHFRVCKLHTSHEIKVMSFNILFHGWNISKGMYSLIQYRKDWTSGILFPLSSTNYFREKSLAYKDIIQNGMKHIFFERHWQNHTCYTTFSFINDISIEPIALNFVLSISMLPKVSMYYND